MFGIGASSSRSSSQGSSFDYGESQSFSDSLSRAMSESQGSSFGSQSVWNADILQKLYADAMGAAGDASGAASIFQGQTADLFNRGSGFLDQLGVGAGEDYLQSRLTDTSARDSQLGALSSGLGDLFRNELNPAITGRGVATGTLGGGRQGVAQGQAVNAIAKQYQQGASSILASDQSQRDQAAGMLGQLGTQRAATGFQGLQGMLGIGQAGAGASMSPYQALAGILGGPTVLSESGSQETGSSSSFARAISEALGFNVGTSQQTSKSKSKSLEF